MEIGRLIKQVKKQSRILVGGFKLSAIEGRFTGPKVLVNSVPKAGTNLLQELVHLLPLMRGRITHPLTLRNGSEWLANELSTIKKGQCAPGHISYDAVADKTIQKNGIHHILIMRDFRDVILSNIRYLQEIHRSHPHNVAFNKLSTLDEKIQACLLGIPEAGMMAWPEMINRYRGWLNSEKILVVRYENLVSQDSKVAEDEIHRIIDFLGIGANINVSEVRRKMFNPNGLTFNDPSIEKWRTNFTQEQITLLNTALCEDLSYFGYKI